MVPQLSSFVHCSFGFDLTERRYHEHYDTSDSCPRVRRGEECTGAVGLEHLMIEDSKLSQSRGSGKTRASCARLHNQLCGWCPPSGNGQFLQVDLGHGFHITAIATQGFLTTKDFYIKKYNVSYSKDGKTWNFFPEVINGNHDGRSVENHNFSSPINARFIRVHPIAPKGKICLRMELYGCSNPLTTTTAPTTQSAPNKTTPPTTTTTAPTSTEKLMINHSATAPSALRTKLLLTTLRVANNEAPENYSPATRATNASSTEKPTIIRSATDQPVGSDKTIIIVIIVIIVVTIAVVIICWLLWPCLRKRKPRNERRSKEGVVGLSAFPRQQPHGSSSEITETSERDWIEDDSDVDGYNQRNRHEQ